MQDPKPAGFRPFLLRLHFYVGLFVGPFIFIAALTGLLYVLTPQIETRLYSAALTASSDAAPRPLAEQAAAARQYLDGALDVSAVRPAPHPGDTTRIMFSDPSLNASENRTVFVDPATLAITGDMTTYGTSGILPFRITLDYLHRNLGLGEVGRFYSELAASWLWVSVLGGVALWASAGRRPRGMHGIIGVTLAVALLLVSVTGLTWSRAAGARIDALRGTLGWVTPSVSTKLDGEMEGHHHHHHDHGTAMREDRTAQLDAVIAAARAAGLDSPMAEIRLPRPGEAWAVREYDRSWPTQVDTVALAPDTLAVTGRADFDSFTLIPKLIRWGVDAHMGVLFGVANQIAMAVVALGLMVTIALGYRMWWRRRPVAALPPLAEAWARMPALSRAAWAAGGIAVGWALPALGVSLVVFVAVDVLRYASSPARHPRDERKSPS